MREGIAVVLGAPLDNFTPERRQWMRKWSQYEAYLYEQNSFFGYEEDEENEYPTWIADELW